MHSTRPNGIQPHASPGLGGTAKHKSPSDVRREARRAIQRERARRAEAWANGGRDARSAAASGKELADAYHALREATAGKVGVPFRGRTTGLYSQPPSRSAASVPGRWPTTRRAS